MLHSELVRLQRATSHEALGLDTGASRSQIRAAFLRDTKRFHPNRFARRGRQVTRLANEVFLRIKEAYYDLAGSRTGALRGTGGASPKPLRSPLAVTQQATEHRRSVGYRTGPQPIMTEELINQAQRGGARADQTGRQAVRRPGQRASQTTGQRARADTGERNAITSGQQRRAGTTGTQRDAASARRTTGQQRAVRRPPTQPGETHRQPSPGAGRRRQATHPGATRSGQTRTRRPNQPSPGDAQIAEGLVRALQLSEQQKWNEAMKVLQGLFKSNPRDRRIQAYAHFIRGREYESVGNLDSARAEYERVLGIDPTLEAAQRALNHLNTRRTPRK